MEYLNPVEASEELLPNGWLVKVECEPGCGDCAEGSVGGSRLTTTLTTRH